MAPQRYYNWGSRLDKPGHFGGALLLFFAILYLLPRGTDTLQTLVISLAAAGIAAAMSLKPDTDKKVLWGVFHRSWITHSLTTVIIATAGTYLLLSSVLKAGPLSFYVALAVFSATLSHVLLDSLTKSGVPLLGPLDNTMMGLRWFRSSNILLNYFFLAAGTLMMLYYYGII
jgi:inner membrane protein